MRSESARASRIRSFFLALSLRCSFGMSHICTGYSAMAATPRTGSSMNMKMSRVTSIPPWNAGRAMESPM